MTAAAGLVADADTDAVVVNVETSTVTTIERGLTARIDSEDLTVAALRELVKALDKVRMPDSAVVQFQPDDCCVVVKVRDREVRA